MKRNVLVALLALMTMSMMAQPPHGEHGHRGPGGHAEHDRHGRPKIECATGDQMRMTMQAIENQPFDDKKLEIAKLCVTLGRFCTNDLERMARKFSFDENRKKFLTYAYSYCTDPQNYYALRDVFEFRTNFDDMMDNLPRSRR